MHTVRAMIRTLAATALLATRADAGEFAAGDIVVSNGSSGAISVFAKDTTFKFSIEAATLGLASADYLAVGMRGTVFVTDSTSDKIVEFGANGWIRTLTVAGLHTPQGILVGPGGSLWIASRGSDQIIVTDPDGSPIRAIDMPVGNGQPTGLTFDAAGRLVVCSAEVGALVAIDPCTGSALRVYPLPAAPTDISINDYGMLVVSLEPMDQVWYLDPEEGTPNQAATIGIESPGGLATSIDGDIFVCSDATDEVLRQVYGPLDSVTFGDGILDDPKDAVVVPHRARVRVAGRGAANDGNAPIHGTKLGKKYKTTAELSLSPGTQDVLLALDDSELASLLGHDLVLSGRTTVFVPGSPKLVMVVGHYLQPMLCDDSEVRSSLSLRYALKAIPQSFDVKASFRGATLQASRSLSEVDFAFSGTIRPIKELN